jgi:hypothetical protein
LTTLSFSIKFAISDTIPDWYYSAVTVFFLTSLGMNMLVTALIVYKIISVYNDTREFNKSSVQASSHGNGRRDLSPLISILIESGLMTFVGQLTQSIMYKTAPEVFPLVGGCVVILYVRASFRLLIWCLISSTYLQGISSTVVLVRVELGITYDTVTTNILSTVDSSNSGRPIQLTPLAFASKINLSQTTTTIVDIAESDDPRSLAERKSIRGSN